VPRLLYDNGADTVLVEDITGGTLEMLLASDPTAATAALIALRRLLDRMHADTSSGIGHGGDDFPGLTCERFALERGLACLTEAAARVPRIAAARSDLDHVLRARAARVRPRATHRLIHGELGPDHVMIDDAGQVVLIDIEGITSFDVEWEHAFLELRFATN
jgi:aminoglycoside phosphotransferase (APT) family kinase protein